MWRLSRSTLRFQNNYVEARFQRNYVADIQRSWLLYLDLLFPVLLYFGVLRNGDSVQQSILHVFCAVLGCSLCLMLPAHRRTDPHAEHSVGLKRLALALWNVPLWQFVTSAVPNNRIIQLVSSPGVHVAAASLLGKVRLQVAVPVQVFSFLVVSWISELVAPAASGKRTQLAFVSEFAVGVLLPMAFAYYKESVSRQAFITKLGLSGLRTYTHKVAPRSSNGYVMKLCGTQQVPFRNGILEQAFLSFMAARGLLWEAAQFSLCLVLCLWLSRKSAAVDVSLPVMLAVLLAAASVAIPLGWLVLAPFAYKRVSWILPTGSNAVFTLTCTLLAVNLPGSCLSLGAFLGCLVIMQCGSALVLANGKGSFWMKINAQLFVSFATLFISAATSWLRGDTVFRVILVAAVQVCCLLVPIIAGARWEASHRRYFLAQLVSYSTNDVYEIGLLPEDAVLDGHSILAVLDNCIQQLANPDLQQATEAAGTLCKFVRRAAGSAELLWCLGAMDVLLNLIASATEHGEEQGTVLGTQLIVELAEDNRDIAEEFCSQGGALIMMEPLEFGSHNVIPVVAAAIAHLCSTHDLHDRFIEEGALELLLDHLDSSLVTVQVPVMQAIAVLVQDKQQCVLDAIAESGGVRHFVGLAACGWQPLVSPAVMTLSALCTSNSQLLKRQVLQFGGLEVLVQCLGDRDQSIAGVAAGAIVALLTVEPWLRSRLVECGAIERLVRLMSSTDESARLFALCALEHLVCTHDPQAAAQFVYAQGVMTLVGIIKDGVTWSVSGYEAATNLLGNLYSSNPGLQRQVLAAGSMPTSVIHLMSNPGQRHAQQAAYLSTHTQRTQGKGKGSKAALAA